VPVGYPSRVIRVREDAASGTEVQRRNLKMTPPPIPPIEDDDLRAAVSALTRAACVMRSLFFLAGEGTPVREILIKHDELATLADDVINKWREHLGISDEDAFAD
jgi:hypothetical protein